MQGPSYTGSIIPNLQTISTLDQYSDQLPYLLLTLPSQDAACSSHQCCHLQQPAHKGQKQQQQGQGEGWCPLQGLPSKLLIGAAQLNPLMILAQQQQQEEPDGKGAKAAGSDKDGSKAKGTATTRGLLQLQHGLVYGPRDVPIGVIPAHAISRAAAGGGAGAWSLEGVSRRLAIKAPQNNTKAAAAANSTAASSASGATQPPPGSSSDDSKPKPQAATDSPSESVQPSSGISEAMAILQWPRPSTSIITTAASGGGREGSASRLPSFKQRMKQQGPATEGFQLPDGLNDEDVAYMTLTQLSGLLRSGQLTPQQLVALYEARITR